MSMWTIAHRNHSDVVLGRAFPRDLEFGTYLNKPGYINYNFPLSEPMAKFGTCRPYVTDFILSTKTGAGIVDVMGGFHTGVQVDQELEVLQINGKDWLHYLERILWPYDPGTARWKPLSADALGGIFQETEYAKDLVAHYLNYCLTGASVANSLGITIDNVNSPGGSNSAIVEPGETGTALDKISELALLGAGSGNPQGLAFRMSPTRHFIETTPSTTFGDVTFEIGANAKLVSYTNNGPRGTRTYGQAQGPSSRLSSIATSGDTTYRRLDVLEDFGTVPSKAALDSLVSKIAIRNSTDQIELSLEYVPNDPTLDVWSTLRPGSTVSIKGDIGYTFLDFNAIIVGIECKVSNEGTDIITYQVDNAAIPF